MKKLLLATMVALTVGFPLMAQTASVLRMSGKVEVLGAGGAWVAAKVGQEIAVGSTISTGFQSQAVLTVGNSQLTVLALTRLTIQELLKTQTGETTTLNLDAGKVRAQVKSAPGQSADFKLRSPVSTAAVRGTEFTFDGYRLDVIEGVVEFFNRLGQSQYVSAGSGSTTSGDDEPGFAEDDHTGDGGGATDGGGDIPRVETTGRLIIVVE